MSVTFDRVVQGDCIQRLGKLDAESVDLAFADPPFNIGYEYDKYDDSRSYEDYYDWSREWIAAVIRVLKPEGAFWLAIGDEYAAELKVLATRELGLTCRNWVVWYYTFGVHCTHKFTRSHAHLFYFVKHPKRFTFNNDAIRVPSARQLVYGDKRAVSGGRVPDDTWMLPPALSSDVPTREGFVLRPQDIPERFPPDSDTWYFSRVAGTFSERQGFHGCQMPEQLLGRIIRACSDEGDVVLDPFAGSGTTLAVAKKLDRRFLGFDLSKDYVSAIRARLKRITDGDALDGPADAARSAPSTDRGRRLEAAMAATQPTETRSPVVARANASLGQIVVANGEYATAIAEAFMAAHEGYSADRVLADPALNDRFLDNCQMLGIPGEPKDWNHQLLGVRKHGGLTAIDTSRRTMCRRSDMEPYIFASEIACQKVCKDHECTLDDILCDPSLADSFDRAAQRIAPGRSSFDYRWAALAVRKDARKGAPLLSKVDDRLARGVIRLADRNRLLAGKGHYLVANGKEPLFVGFSSALRDCPFFDADRIAAVLDMMGRCFKGDGAIAIRIRAFDPASFGNLPKQGDETSLKAARREKLLDRHKPIANVPVPPRKPANQAA